MAGESKHTVIIDIRARNAEFRKVMEQVRDRLETVKGTLNGVAAVAGLSQEQFRRVGESLKTVNNVGVRFAGKMRMMTSGLRGFRMEMLGVMFFGMAMSRMFSQMFQPISEVFGIFELWRVMLQVLFLPIMAMLMPFLISFMEFFMNLPEPVQTVLGVMALLGMIFGKILFVVGTLALGIGSLFQTSTIVGLIKFWGLIKGFFAWLLTAAAATIAAVVLTVVGMVVAWKENFNQMKEWVDVMVEGVKNIFGGLVEFFSGLWETISSAMTGDWEGMIEGLKKMWDGTKQFFLGVIGFLVGLLLSIGTGALRALKTVIKAILPEFAEDWVNIGIGFIRKAIEGIKGMASEFIEALLALFPDKLRSTVSSFFGFKNVGDFIMRPGQQPIQTDPNDTLVGFKGDSPFGGGPTVNITNNITVSDKEEFERILDENNSKLVDTVLSKSNLTGG